MRLGLWAMLLDEDLDEPLIVGPRRRIVPVVGIERADGVPLVSAKCQVIDDEHALEWDRLVRARGAILRDEGYAHGARHEAEDSA